MGAARTSETSATLTAYRRCKDPRSLSATNYRESLKSAKLCKVKLCAKVAQVHGQRNTQQRPPGGSCVGYALSRTCTNLVLGNSLLHAPNLNQQLAWWGGGARQGPRLRGATDADSQSVCECVLVKLGRSMMTETTVTVTTTEGAPGHNATSQPTVKSDPGQGQNSLAWIRLNFLYFRTIPGILKLLQVVSYHPLLPLTAKHERRIWGSRDSDPEVECRLGCDPVLSCKQLPTLRRHLCLHLLLS
jgi:hypothetical protein